MRTEKGWALLSSGESGLFIGTPAVTLYAVLQMSGRLGYGPYWYEDQGWPLQCPTPLDDKTGWHLPPIKAKDWALCGLPAPGSSCK